MWWTGFERFWHLHRFVQCGLPSDPAVQSGRARVLSASIPLSRILGSEALCSVVRGQNQGGGIL